MKELEQKKKEEWIKHLNLWSIENLESLRRFHFYTGFDVGVKAERERIQNILNKEFIYPEGALGGSYCEIFFTEEKKD